MTLKVWLEIVQQAAAGSGALLMTALKQAQVTVARRYDDKVDGAGIVLFAEADTALLQALPALCSHASVLAIAACDQPPSCAQQRALMAAGALDVLLWPEGAIDVGQVLASSAVRQQLVGDSAAWTGGASALQAIINDAGGDLIEQEHVAVAQRAISSQSILSGAMLAAGAGGVPNPPPYVNPNTGASGVNQLAVQLQTVARIIGGAAPLGRNGKCFM